MLIPAEGEKLSCKIIRGEVVTAAPHLFASGVHFQLAAYAVSCAASTMYTSETKARRMIKFLFVTGILSVVSFSFAPLSTTHMLITDLFELLGKEQKVVQCARQLPLLPHGCLHTQPARSTHVKPRTGMAPMRVSEVWPLSGASFLRVKR